MVRHGRSCKSPVTGRGSSPLTTGQLSRACPEDDSGSEAGLLARADAVLILLPRPGREGTPSPHLQRSGSPPGNPGPPRTLGGDGVLRAAWGGRLRAVAAGALERVPAAPLRVQLEAPRQGQRQFLASLHLLTRLHAGGTRETQTSHRGRECPVRCPQSLSAYSCKWEPP